VSYVLRKTGVTWNVQRARGSATEFHQRDVPDERTIWIFEVEQPALVLGSSQAMADVDGIEVVRRRSGGGAVYVAPGGTLWVDVVVPRGDDLWDDDVGRATYWLGEVWAAAIGDHALVHRGAMVRNEWSDLVCFAGLGPGEVTVDGRKVVGISQRRTRQAARFQCVAYERWDPQPLVELLHLEADLEVVGAGVGPLAAVEAALISAFR
jgi:lipoate-protein ligase A